MEKIREILHLQYSELRKKLNEKYIKREAELKYLSEDLIKVIIGPRRSGKSFFAIHTLKETGNFIYLNFDDEELMKIKDINGIMRISKEIYGDTRNVFMDEIQNYPEWEIISNRLQRQGYNLVLSGSNSNLLSSELSTHLTGRHIPIYIFPFSLSEYMNSIENEQPFPENALSDYANTGGYPEVILKNINLKDYLELLYDSVIYKDILQRYKIRKEFAISNIANHLISNIGTEFSFRTLAKITEIKSIATLNRYLGYLSNSFLLFSVQRYSFKSKDILSHPGKIYSYDNGYIKAKSLSINKDIGKLYENLAAVYLMKKKLKGEIDFYFYTSNDKSYEVDFLVRRKNNNIELIQVSYDISDDKTLQREIRALINASKHFKTSELILLNKSIEKEEYFEWFGEKRKIKFQKLSSWLRQ